MYVQVLKAIDDLRASYWFVPLCMLVFAIALALFTRWLDASAIVEKSLVLSFIAASGVDDARTILSVIATSVMGVAGVTFSITIVAVSFASSNFGPRLIGNFMRDRGNQFTLGTFVGTFSYCLIILATVHGESDSSSGVVIQSFVPYFSVMTALALALGCISVLIYYIHHIAETINIENIIADIGQRLMLRIDDIYPEFNADNVLPDEKSFKMATKELKHTDVSSESIGYVQAIDHEKLVELTIANQLLTRVHYRPGDFVTPHDCLLSVWSDDPCSVPADDLRICFATGLQRTEHQNVLFLVEQLAEVIARALSPGVNDPFTAISCLKWYYVAILEYVKSYPAGKEEQAIGKCRVQIAPVTLERLTSVMFDSTRQYVVADMNVLLQAMAMLCECAWHADSGSQRQTLVSHIEQFHSSGLHAYSDAIDVAAINKRYEQSMFILDDVDPISRKRYDASWFGGSA